MRLALAVNDVRAIAAFDRPWALALPAALGSRVAGLVFQMGRAALTANV